MSITEFLLARIAEDEAAAHEEDRDYAHTSLLPTYDSEHQARWDTDRVLAECQAKRAIVERRAPYDDIQVRRQTRTLAGDALRHLAAVYSDHPDYREEWKPAMPA